VSHLAERISELVDGRLAPEATEQAHAHLAGCPTCREMVEAERLTKARLSALEAPALSAELLGRLLAVGGASDVVRDLDVPALDAGPAGSRRPARRGAALRPSARSSGRLSRRPGRARLAAAMAGSFGVLGAGVFALSVASPTANAAMTPTANLVVARHVVTMSGLPILNLLPGWRVAPNAPGR
jgi:anti-sigma factor RsiW